MKVHEKAGEAEIGEELRFVDGQPSNDALDLDNQRGVDDEIVPVAHSSFEPLE